MAEKSRRGTKVSYRREREAGGRTWQPRERPRAWLRHPRPQGSTGIRWGRQSNRGGAIRLVADGVWILRSMSTPPLPSGLLGVPCRLCMILHPGLAFNSLSNSQRRNRGFEYRRTILSIQPPNRRRGAAVPKVRRPAPGETPGTGTENASGAGTSPPGPCWSGARR